MTPVIFKFSKTLVGDAASTFIRPGSQLRLYKITDEQGETLAEFHYGSHEQIVKLETKEIRIEPIKQQFKRKKLLLFDGKDQTQTGEIKINTQGISYFWKDVPSDANAIITFCGADYYFRRIQPDTPYDWFKKASWGHFKFILYSNKCQDAAYFSLKMDIPVVSKPNYTKYIPFEGIIESSFANVSVITLAFYLFELEFDAEDQKYDG
jgi:hypothetical protein